MSAVAVDFVGIRVVDDWLVVDVDVHGWNAERRDAEFREDYEYGEHRLDGEHCGDGFGVTRTERDARLQLGAEGEGATGPHNAVTEPTAIGTGVVAQLEST